MDSCSFRCCEGSILSEIKNSSAFQKTALAAPIAQPAAILASAHWESAKKFAKVKYF
jgi:hypothetical protein